MASKKLKKLLKKVGKAAIIGGAGYAAIKGLQNRKENKENKEFLKTEGGDKSDMSPTTRVDNYKKIMGVKPAKKTGTIAGDYSGIVDYGEDIDVSTPSTPRKKLTPGPKSIPLIPNAGFKSGGRVKGCGKALRGYGRALKGKR
tara:strand:- start:457 stop:885 length:429 start_codon:yes stop_codon:yes gene_type:complete